MKIIKLEHSGFAVENADKTLVVDPVEYEFKLPNFFNVAGIVITHKHGDHLQLDVVNRILSANPAIKVYTTIDTSMIIPNSVIVQKGSVQELEGFRLEFFGENHASIFDGQVPCQNVGVLINSMIVDPGDSFDLPSGLEKPKILLAPLSAPWCKVADTVDFIKKANPETVVPFHDSVLSELGKGFNNNCLKTVCDELNAKFEPLRPGESIDL